MYNLCETFKTAVKNQMEGFFDKNSQLKIFNFATFPIWNELVLYLDIFYIVKKFKGLEGQSLDNIGSVSGFFPETLHEKSVEPEVVVWKLEQYSSKIPA